MSTCNCCNKPCTHTVYYTPLIRVGQVDFTVCKSGVLISDRIAPIEGIDNNYIKFQSIDPTIVGADISLKNGTSFYTGPYGSITFPKTTITSINSSANVANLAGTFTGNGFVDAVEFQYITQPDDYINGIDCYTLNPMQTPFYASSGYFNGCYPVIDIKNLQIDPCQCNRLYPSITGIQVYNDSSIEINDDTSYVGRDTLDYNYYHPSCKDGKYYRAFSAPSISINNPIFINHYDSGSTSIIYQKYKNIYGGLPCYYASGIQSGNLITPVDKYSQKLDVFIFGPTLSYTKFSNRNFSMSCNIGFCDNKMYFSNVVNPVYDSELPSCNSNINTNTLLNNIFSKELNTSGTLNVDFNKSVYDRAGNYFYPIVFDLIGPEDQPSIVPSRTKGRFSVSWGNIVCDSSSKIISLPNISIPPPEILQEDGSFYDDTSGGSCIDIQSTYFPKIGISKGSINFPSPSELNGWSVGLAEYSPPPLGFVSKWIPVVPISITASWSLDYASVQLANIKKQYYLSGGTDFEFTNGINYNNCGIITHCNEYTRSLNPKFTLTESLIGNHVAVLASFGGDKASYDAADNIVRIQNKIPVFYEPGGGVFIEWQAGCDGVPPGYGMTKINFSASYRLTLYEYFFNSYSSNPYTYLVWKDPQGKLYYGSNIPGGGKSCGTTGNGSISVQLG